MYVHQQIKKLGEGKGKGVKGKGERYFIFCPSTSSINKYNKVLTKVTTI